MSYTAKQHVEALNIYMYVVTTAGVGQLKGHCIE